MFIHAADVFWTNHAGGSVAKVPLNRGTAETVVGGQGWPSFSFRSLHDCSDEKSEGMRALHAP